MICFLLISLLRRVCAGPIHPDLVSPISLLRTNAGQTSRYSFSFRVTTPIIADASVTVEFPLQFKATNLGLPSPCSAYDLKTSPVTALSCTPSFNGITLKVGQLDAGLFTFRVEDVANPTTSGATGNFIVRTWQGSTVVDENALYPPIGIAEAPTSISTTLSAQGNLGASFSPLYQFKATGTIYYPPNSWIRVIFPADYYLKSDEEGSPRCYLQEIKSWVGCHRFEDSTTLHVDMISVALSAGTLTLNVFDVKNPAYAGTTGGFVLEVMREHTYTVYSRSTPVGGVVITPGTIGNVSILGSPLYMNLQAEYTITLKVKNPIPQGGSISVVFPSTFQTLVIGSCYGANGLQPLSSIVTCSIATNTMLVGGFAAVQAQQSITLAVAAINPAVPGLTSYFELRTFKDSGGTILIDQNLQAGKVTISNVQHAQGQGVDMFQVKTDVPVGSYGPLDLFFMPRTLPGISGPTMYYQFVLNLPASVSSSGVYSCTFGKAAVPGAKCSYAASVLTFQTPASVVPECCPLAITLTTLNAGVNEGFMLNSNFAGEAVFNLKYYSTATLLEEAEFRLKTSPRPFAITMATDFRFVHQTRDLWNVVAVDLTTNVDIPTTGVIEFEFQTHAWSFPMDLGWQLTSFATHAFPCVNTFAASGPLMTGFQCVLTAGTTEKPAYVRLTGFTAIFTKNVKRTILLGNVKNAPYSGYTPSFILRSKDNRGFILEESQFTFGVPLEDKPLTPSVGTATATTAVTDVANDEYVISFTLAGALSAATNDGVYFVFPHGYKWPTNYSGSVKACTGNPMIGAATNYVEFTQHQAHSILFTTKAAMAAGAVNFCLKVDNNSLWFQTPVIQALVVQNHKVIDVVQVTGPTVVPQNGVTLQGVKPFINSYNMNSRNLWELTFTAVNRITYGGTIQVLFPITHWASVDTTCYKVYPSTINSITPTCAGELNFMDPVASIYYHRILLSEFAPSPQLNSGDTFTVQFYAKTGKVTGSPVVQVFSQDEDSGTDKRIDNWSQTYTIPDVYQTFNAEVDSPITSHQDARKNEWGPIRLKFQTTVTYPGTSNLEMSMIRVTFPVGLFPQSPSPPSYLDCRVNTVLARHCEHIASGPDVYEVYSPLTINPGQTIELVLHTRRASPVDQNGFRFPATPGDYKFIMDVRMNYNGAAEQGEAWLHVPYTRFTDVSIKSYHKLKSEPNVYDFNFVLATAIPTSNHATTPGVIWIEFPYDPSVVGRGWQYDLGMGFPDGYQIDCDDTLTTAPKIGANINCFLIHGFVDYVKIKVTGFAACSPGNKFNLKIPGIWNPVAALYDLPIRVRSLYEDLSTYSNPLWVVLDEALDVYVDTTFNWPTYPQAGQNSVGSINVVAAQKNQATPNTQGAVNANIKVNIENSAALVVNDEIWIQFPVGFVLNTIPTTNVNTGTPSSSCAGTPQGTSPIKGFPRTRWVLVKSCTALNVMNYGAAQNPNFLYVDQVTLPNWTPFGGIKFRGWYLDEQKALNKIDPQLWDATRNIQRSGLCNILELMTEGIGAAGAVETYRFRFICPTNIPAGGSFKIYFPADYSAAYTATCEIGLSTQLYPPSGLKCAVYSGVEVQVSGFTVAYRGGDVIEVLINALNPSTALTSGQFIVRSFYDDINPVEQMKDEQLNAGTITTITAPAPVTIPAAGFLVGTQNIMYHDVEPLRNVAGMRTGPLRLNFTPKTTLVKKVDYIKITTKQVISIGTNAQMRCVWLHTIERLAFSCTFAPGASNVITMFTPEYYDAVAGDSYSLYLTTVFADNGVEGFTFGSGLGRYIFDIEEYQSPATLLYKARTYFSLLPQTIPTLEVVYGHSTEGIFTRLQYKFDTAATAIPASASGGRIYVELETANGMFLDDLGLGISENGVVPCQWGQTSTYTTGTLNCYIKLGVSALSYPVKIIVTGFGLIPASQTGIIIDFPKIYNPAVGADYKLVNTNIYAVDASSSNPGTYLMYRTVKYVYLITQDTVTPYPAETVSVAPNKLAPNTGDYTFDIPAANDFFVIQLPPLVSISTTTPACSVACYYYPQANVVVLTAPSGTATITNITNPPYVLTPANYLKFHGYSWQNFRCTGDVTYSDLAEPFVGNALTPNYFKVLNRNGVGYNNDIVEYAMQVTVDTPVPSTGAITLTFSAGTLPESACYNFYPDAESDLVGPFACTIAGLKATITGFQTVASGKKVAIRILIKNPASGTITLTAETWYDAAATVVLQSGTANSGAMTVNTPTYFEFQRQEWEPQPVYANDYGTIRFNFTPTSTIVRVTGYIMVYLPTGFQLKAVGSDLVCLWDNIRSSNCYFDTLDSRKIYMYGPYNVDITTKTEIEITTTNADDIDQVGIQYPAAAGIYGFELWVDYTGDGTIDTVAQDAFEVYPTSDWTSIAFDIGTTSESYTNQLHLTAKPTTAIPLNGEIRLYLDVKDRWNLNIWAADLSTGVTDNFPLLCKGDGTYLKAVAGQALYCLLRKGSAVNDPVRISVFNFQAVVTTNAFDLWLWGVKNPSSFGSDDRHVHIALLSIDSTGTFLDYRLCKDVYSITKDMFTRAPPPAPPALTAITVTPSPTNVGTAPTFKVPMPAAVGKNTRFILVLPPAFAVTASISCAVAPGPATCTKHVEWNALEISPVGSASAPIITISSLGNLQYIPTNTIFYLYEWGEDSDQILVTYREYAPYATLAASFKPATIVAATIKNPTAQTQSITAWEVFSFTTPTSISSTGLIEFELPTNMGFFHDFCVPGLSSILAAPSYTCAVATNAGVTTVTITNFPLIAAASTVEVLVPVKYTTTNPSGNLVITTYQDTAKTMQIATATSTPVITLTPLAHPLMYFPPQHVAKTVAANGDFSEIRFKFKPTSAMAATDYLLIKPQNAFDVFTTNARMMCTVDDQGTNCSANGARTIVTVNLPFALASGTQYEVVVYTHGADGGVNGLKLKNNSKNPITIEAYVTASLKFSGVQYFSVPNSRIPQLTIAYLHRTADSFNAFTVSMKLKSNLNNNDSIVVEFPTVNYAGTAMFANDLGTGKSNNAAAYCDQFVGLTPSGTAIKCTLQLGKAAAGIPAKVVISGFSNLAGGTLISFVLPRYKNPAAYTTQDTVIASIAVYTMDNTGVIVEYRAIDELFAVRTSTTIKNQSPTAPTFSSTVTSTTPIDLNIICQSTTSVDAATNDRYVIEMPAQFTLPSSGLTDTKFTTVVTYPSANWIVLSTGTSVTCNTAVTLKISGLQQSSTPVAANALVLKAYMTEDLVLSDVVTYTAVVSAITAATGSGTLTFTTLTVPEESSWNQQPVTFSCATAIPVGGRMDFKFVRSSDSAALTTSPPYATVSSATPPATFSVVYDSTANTYKVTTLKAIAASTSIAFSAYILNPASVNSVKVTATAYDASLNQICSDNKSVSVTASTYTKTGSAFIRILDTAPVVVVGQFVGTNNFDKITLDFSDTNFKGANAAGDPATVISLTGGTVTTATWTSTSILEVNFAPPVNSPWKLDFQISAFSINNKQFAPVKITTNLGGASKELVNTQSFVDDAETDYHLHRVVANSEAMLKGRPGQPIDVLQILFHVSPSDSAFYAINLGESYVTGDAFPFVVSPSVTTTCTVSVGISAYQMPAVGECSFANNPNGKDIYAAKFKMGGAGTAYTEVIGWQLKNDGSRDYLVSELIITTIPAGPEVASASCSFTAASYTVQQANDHTLTLTGIPDDLKAASWLLVFFQDGIKAATPATDGWINTAVFLADAPVLLLEMKNSVPGGGNAALTAYQIVNSMFQGAVTVDVYTLFNFEVTPSSFYHYTCSTSAYVKGAITFSSVSVYGSWLPSSSVYVDLTLAFANEIRKGGSVFIDFPNTIFSAVDCSSCTKSGFTDISASSPVTFTVTATGSAQRLTITNFQKIAIPSLSVSVMSIYTTLKATAAGSFTLFGTSLYYPATATSVIDDGNSANQNIGSGTALAYPNLVFPYSSLYTGFNEPDANTQGNLSFYFSTKTTLNMDSNASPGYLKLTVTANTLKVPGSSALWCKWKNYATSLEYAAHTCSIKTAAGKDTLTITTPEFTDIAANTKYLVTVTTRNDQSDGLTYAAAGTYAVTTATPTGNTETQSVNFFISKLFSSFDVMSYNGVPSSMNLIEVTLKPATSVSKASRGEVVVEFPTYWSPRSWSIYANDLGSGLSDGAAVPCNLFQSYTLKTDSGCRLEVGAGTEDTPVRVVLTPAINLSSGTSYTVGFPNILNPAAKTAHVTVYTRILVANAWQVQDLMQLQVAVFINPTYTTTSYNLPYPASLVGKTTGATNQSISITFDVKSALNTPGAMAFYMNKVLQVDSTWTEQTRNSRVYPGSNWIVVYAGAAISGSTTFTFKQVTIPPYSPVPSGSWAIEAYNLYSNKFPAKFVFDQPAVPNPLFGAGPITINSFTCPLCFSLYRDGYVQYVVNINPSSDTPSSGSITITFPNAVNQYQSLQSDCWAYSTGFATRYGVACAASGQTWTITGFGGYTQGPAIYIVGRAKNPTIAWSPTSKSAIIRTCNDAAGTQIINEDTSVSFTILNFPQLLWPNLFQLYSPRTSSLRPLRMNDKGPLIFYVQPLKQISKDTDSITLTVKKGQFSDATVINTSLVCKFLDTLNSNKEIKSKECTISTAPATTDIFTVKAAKFTDITTSQKWGIKITTKVLKLTGVPYPDPTPNNMSVMDYSADSGNEKATWELFPIPAKMPTVRSDSYCRSTDFRTVAYVKFKTTVKNYSASDRVAVQYPTPMYLNDFNTGLQESGDLKCYTDMLPQAALPVRCLLDLGNGTRLIPRWAEVYVVEHKAFNAVQKVYIPYFANPTLSGQNAKIRVKSYSLAAGGVETIIGDEVIYHVFGTSTNANSLVHSNSYLTTISSNLLEVSGVTFNVLTNIGAAQFKTTDYVIWRLPVYMGATISVAKNAGNTQNIEKQWQSVPDGRQWIMTYPGAGTPYTANIRWDFSSVVNPSFFPSPDPVLEADVIIGKDHAFHFVYDLSLPLNYQPVALTVGHVWASDVTNAAYKNGYIDYEFQFSMPVTLPSTGSFKITFPAGFTLDASCNVASTVPTPLSGAFVSCVSDPASPLDIIVSNFSGYTNGNTVTVVMWAANPTATGLVTFKLYAYSVTPPTATGHYASGTATLTINNVNAINPLTNTFYTMSDPYLPVRALEQGPIYFTLTIPAQIKKKDGSVTIWFAGTPSFIPDVAPPPPVPICTWSDGTTVYGAFSCTYTTQVLTVTAPEFTDIPVGNWVIYSSTRFVNNREGYTFPNYGRDYGVTAAIKSDLTTDEQFGYGKMRVPGASLFSTNQVSWYNICMNTENIFDFQFKPSVALNAGLGLAAGGFSSFEVSFDVSTFASDLGQGLSNNARTDCFNVANLAGVDCYLGLGSTPANKWPTVKALYYTSGIATGTTVTVQVPWVLNPTAKDTIVHVRLEAHDIIANLGQSVMYKEFRYLWATDPCVPVNTPAVTISYATTTMQTTSNIGFTVASSAIVPSAGIYSRIMWRLTETEPPWTPTYCTAATHSCFSGSVNRLEMLKPGANVAINNVLTIVSFPTPRYNIGQQWTGYIYIGQKLTDVLTYNNQIFGVQTLPTVSVTRITDGNSPNPFTSRVDEYVVKLRTTYYVMVGGEVRVELPTGYTTLSDCNILHGLKGNGIRCRSISGTEMSVTGFTQYNPADPAIVLSVKALNPNAATSPASTTNFKVFTYGIALSTATGIEQHTAVQTYIVVGAPGQPLSFYFPTQHQTQVPLCQTSFLEGPLTLRITPYRNDVTYLYKDYLTIEIPTLPYTLTQTTGSTLECTFDNGPNITPASICTFAGTTITVGFTDQQTFLYNVPYRVDIYTRDATAGVMRNGFNWLKVANPTGRLSFYVQVYQGGVVKEAAKIDVDICPQAFTSLSLTPFHKDTQKWNIFDLSFVPTNAIPQTGGVAIAFPSNNELDYTFALDLGQGMYPLVMSQPVDCMVQAGFAGAGIGQIQCTLKKSLSATPQTPAIVEIGNLPGVITAGTTNTIRIVKLQNPLLDVSTVIAEPMTVDFNVWTFDFQYYADRYTLNNQTLLRLYDYGQLLNPVFTTVKEATVPACTVTDTYTTITAPLTIPTTLGVTVKASVDAIVYEFDSSFDFPTTGQSITCSLFGSDSCQVYKLASWIVYFVTAGTVTGARTFSSQDPGSNVYKTPVYMSPTGYPFHTYVIVTPRWVEEHTYTNMVTRAASESLTVTLSHTLSTLNLRTYDVWTFTITPAKRAKRLQRVDIIFPSQFMWTDPTCKLVSGVQQSMNNADPISCTSDCASEVCTNRLTLSNFYDPSPYAGPIVVEVGAKNPEVSGITSTFQVYYYSSLTDTTAIIEKRTNTLAQTITTVTYPYDFWLEWPTVTMYKRLIQPGAFGEVYFYFTSRVTVPSATGWYKIIFPEEFDIAPGATPLCTVYHTDNPFDNFPSRWSNAWNHPIMGTCTWDEGEVALQFDPDRLRVFYGTKPNICTYLVLYTTGATNGVNGIQAPTSEGCYEIEVYAMDGPVLLEAGYPQMCSSAALLPLSALTLSNLDVGKEAILSVAFTTTKELPKSYYYLNGNFPGPVTVIRIEFETYNSFATNPLPAGVTTPDCYALSGLTPKTGESLKCTLTVGKFSGGTALVHDPAVITVTNFEKVLASTFVEIHFPRIVNPGTAGYVPQIRVGVYSLDYLGNIVWLYSLNSISIPAVSASAPVASVAGTATLSSAVVLDRVNLKLDFKATTGNLVSGDMVVFTFPAMFNSIPASGVTASIVKNAYTTPSTETYVINPRVVTYPQTYMTAITLKTGQTVISGETLDITLYNFTNPSYIETACATGCPISYYSIRSQKIKDQRATGNFISPTVSLTAAGFTSMKVVTDTLYVGDVNNIYVFLMETLVQLSAGTTTTVSMPAAFPDISTSVPAVYCWSNFTQTCTVASQSFVLTGYSAIPRGTVLSATLSGVRNPSASGFTSTFGITTKDSSGRSITSASFPAVYINPQKPVNKCFLKIETEFPNAGLTSDYNFTISPVSPLPRGTVVSLKFPSEYPTLPVASKCEVFLPLDSYQSCTIKSPSVTLVTNNALASAETFTIRVTNVINPAIKTADANGGMTTNLFSIALSYDSVTLDINDPNSSQSTVYITAAAAAFLVTTFQVSPQTEAEYARYSFTFNAPLAIAAGDNFSIFVKFPIEYRTQLVEDGFDLYCLSRNRFAGCVLGSSRKVQFYHVIADIEQGLDMGLEVFGVVNPLEGLTSDFAVYLYDTQQKKALAASEVVGRATIMPLPYIFNMTSVTSELNLTHVHTQHNLTFSIESVDVSAAGRIWLDWPGDYNKLFLTPPYKCAFYQGPALVTASSALCSWLVETALKRSELTGYPTIPAKSGVISFLVQDIPTLQAAGRTGPFILRIFEYEKNVVTLRSYPDLTPYSSLQFSDQGYKVFVTPSYSVTVYRGLFSSEVTFKLQKATFEELKFTPYIPSGGFRIVPDPLLFQYAWGTTISVRVKASIVTTAGDYVVNWISYEEQSQRKYQPVSDLSVTVLEPAAAVPVTCSEISPTMVAGTSQPVIVTLELPTVDGVTVKLSTVSPVQDEFVLISPQELVYIEGESRHNFTITLVPGAISGFVKLELSGETAPAYYLPKDKVQFLSMPTSNLYPKIVDTRIHQLGRTTAAIRVLCSQIALVHHVLAHDGTDPPLIPLFVHGVLGRSSLPQMYNVTSTNYYSFVADLMFEGLTDETDYVVYITLTSQTGVFGTQLEKVQFRTMPAHRAAKVRLYTSTIVQWKTVLKGLATTLSIPEDHFALTAIDPYIGDKAGRRLEVNPYQKDVYYEFQLVIGHNETYSSPASYLSQLPLLTSDLTANIPSYSPHDLTQSISEVASTYPEIEEVREVQSGPGWAAVTVRSNVGGKVYGVLLRKGMRAPSAFHITQAMDGHTWEVDAGRSAVVAVERGGKATLNFTGLLDNVVYEAHIAAENDAPLPKLMESYSVKRIEVNSEAANIDSSIVFHYLDSAYFLSLMWVVWTLV